jgi:hypothetical protein
MWWSLVLVGCKQTDILNQRQKGAGQGMVLTGHIHTCFLLAQDCKSGWKLCGKVGFGDKVSHLNMCYFHDFFINFTVKKHGALLSGQTSISSGNW